MKILERFTSIERQSSSVATPTRALKSFSMAIDPLLGILVTLKLDLWPHEIRELENEDRPYSRTKSGKS